ncbi:queuosine precursor transporter [Pelagicoccus albus]|uniref:Probable queuosine precursor transporter n=1 Tax=Pelagicoccus albus TaxID=415222 RepID=A0A7X1B4E1_9BACT|nr:queuosine precursor transporter [Pelagicoccus albus]MBC2605438.1 queuosine precursor transporter [Pelagicoccus albus]
MNRETKYLILFGFYVGFWGMLQSLTVKLVPLDLSSLGLGVLAFSYGSFVHALTFPCTDAVAEVWGAKRARLMVYMGTVVYIFCTVMLVIGVNLAPAEGWAHNEAYRAIFQGAPRIVAGSLVATIVAQLWDIYVFEWVKKKTGPKHLWLRNNLSTFGSQFLDTCIFYLVGFYGIIPTEILPGIILGSYLMKLLVAVIDTPIVYVIVAWIRSDEKKEALAAS